MPFRCCHVLIADDDPAVALYLGRLMESMGFDYDIAPTVGAAITKMPIADIAIVDMKMNGDTGGEYSGNLIIDRWLETHRGPICVLSAYITPDLNRDLLERGVWNALSKPAGNPALRTLMMRYGTIVIGTIKQAKDQKELDDLRTREKAVTAANDRHRLAAIALAAVLLGSKIVPWILTLLGVSL